MDAEVCGESYRFVNTHLEIASEPGSSFGYIQSEQMQDLLDELYDEYNPVLLDGNPQQKGATFVAVSTGVVKP